MLELTQEERARQALAPPRQALARALLACRGYVVLRGALAPELTDAVCAQMGAVLEDCRASAAGVAQTPEAAAAPKRLAVSPGLRAVYWLRESRWRIFPRLTGALAEPGLLANPFVLGALEALLGPGVHCKWVSSDTCCRGSLLQSPHSDIENHDVIAGDAWRPRGYIVNVAITECGLHNGPLEVWPNGSHMYAQALTRQLGLSPDVQDGRNPPVEELAALMPSVKLSLARGDVLIRDLAMWHRGTPNPTDAPRTMLTMALFRAGYAYGYGDASWNLSREDYAALAPEVRRLFAHHFEPGLLDAARKLARSLRARAAPAGRASAPGLARLLLHPRLDERRAEAALDAQVAAGDRAVRG